MKKAQPLLVIFFFSVSLFLVVACGMAPPTLTPEENQASLATMVAATVESGLANPNGGEMPDTPADGEPASAPEESAAPAQDTPATAIPMASPPLAGLRVAYVKDGNVYIWTEGGNRVGITSTGDAYEVHISSDGLFVAFVREISVTPYTYELWVVNADGGTLNPRLLVSSAEMNALKAASPFADAAGFAFDQILWRPGTHDLYYSTVPRFDGPGYVPTYDLRIINTDTLEKRALFDFGEAGAFEFSPDGTQLVLSAPDHISLVNADGSNLRANILTYPLVGTYSEYQYWPKPIWAPDSASLRVAIPPADVFDEPTPPSTLWFLPVDGSPATQLGSIPTLPFSWPDNIFSPNLSYIAYLKSVGEPSANQHELHIAYPDGSGDYIFATGEGLQFSGWTPDSTRFVYSLNGADDQSLYLGTLSNDVSTITSLQSTIFQMRWLDSERFIFIMKNQTAPDWEFRISHVGGTRHAFIDTFAHSYKSFDFTQ